jgi:hypothetical protein
MNGAAVPVLLGQLLLPQRILGVHGLIKRGITKGTKDEGGGGGGGCTSSIKKSSELAQGQLSKTNPAIMAVKHD